MAQQPEQVVLEVASRESLGKGAAHAIRRQGLVPGVVYGEGKASIAVQVPSRELGKALQTKAGGNVLISLRMEGGSTKSANNLVLIKELQHHPVSHQIVHVDFHKVSLTKKIIVTVPLAFKGEAVGVKQGGGLLEHIRWDVEVECLPTRIPSEIPVDVSGLEVGQSLMAKSISLPEGVRLVIDPELPVVTCQIPKVEVPVSAEEAEAQPTEPEVLKQKKPEEAGAEETAGKEKKEAPAKEKAKG